MKIYLKENVFDACLDRLRYLFDEFDKIIVSFSGGKDSTVIFNMAMIVAKEKNKLPLIVMFLDQEAEWQAVVDYTRAVMQDPGVEPHWLQVPIRLFNATSSSKQWLHCWGEGEQWMREKEDIAIKENKYGVDRFVAFFPKYINYHFPNQSVAMVGGVRAEESPNRKGALCNDRTYKHISWGKLYNKDIGHYIFYPLYDWSYKDVWKSIHDNGWKYCSVYNDFYRYGIPPLKMRVSNLHHETAVDQLFYLHEIEPETWSALQVRLQGVNQAKHITKRDLFAIKELPYMFKDWQEYRDYLVDNLIVDDKAKQKFKKRFARLDELYGDMENIHDRHQNEIQCVLTNDHHFMKLENFTSRPETINFRNWKKGRDLDWSMKPIYLKYIPKHLWGTKCKNTL